MKRPVFEFDERSYDSLDSLIEKHGEDAFMTVEIRNPNTGEVRTLFLKKRSQVND